jgi:hypothetical protein
MYRHDSNERTVIRLEFWNAVPTFKLFPASCFTARRKQLHGFVGGARSSCGLPAISCVSFSRMKKNQGIRYLKDSNRSLRRLHVA